MARTRSPNYPGIGLREAIKKTTQLYEAEGQAAVPSAQAFSAWGLKAGTGQANVVLSALRKYGLITYEGKADSRGVKLTTRALRIVRDKRPESRERDEEIRRAALNSVIYRDLWAEARDGASDGTLKQYLKIERGFSDSAVDRLIHQFRDTISYSGLTESDIMSEVLEDKGLGEDIELTAEQTGAIPLRERPPGARPPLATPDHRTYRLPLPSQDEAILQVPGIMDGAAWDQMMAVLRAMKPGILTDTEDE